MQIQCNRFSLLHFALVLMQEKCDTTAHVLAKLGNYACIVAVEV